MDAIVYYPVTTSGFLSYMAQTASSNQRILLVVCTDRHTFLQQLNHSIVNTSRRAQFRNGAENADDDTSGVIIEETNPALPPLVTSLYLLHATKNVKLAFCNSVTVLHAYLASLLAYRDPCVECSMEEPRSDTVRPIFALINPISLHKDTPLFSAQSLGRTFASAVEAALGADEKLIIVECLDDEPFAQPLRSDDYEHGLTTRRDEDTEMGNTADAASSAVDSGGMADPWEQPIPILDSARASGFGAERAWVGQTTTAGTVAGRWCRFESMR